MRKHKFRRMLFIFILLITIPAVISIKANRDNLQKEDLFKQHMCLLNSAEAKRLLTCSKSVTKPVTGYWTPTRREVEAIDAQMPTFFKTLPLTNSDPPISTYYRQYCGYLEKKRKMIYVIAFTEPVPADWKNRAVSSCGLTGNLKSPYIEVVYDVGTMQFGRAYGNKNATAI